MFRNKEKKSDSPEKRYARAKEALSKGKPVVITGQHGAGKTTLSHELMEEGSVYVSLSWPRY